MNKRVMNHVARTIGKAMNAVDAENVGSSSCSLAKNKRKGSTKQYSQKLCNLKFHHFVCLTAMKSQESLINPTVTKVLDVSIKKVPQKENIDEQKLCKVHKKKTKIIDVDKKR